MPHLRRSFGSFGFAELLVDGQRRILAANAVAREAGVPSAGGLLTLASPLAAAALELSAACLCGSPLVPLVYQFRPATSTPAGVQRR